MPKTPYPFKLHQFNTTNPSGVELVLGDLGELLDFIVLKELEVIRDSFDNAVTKVVNNPKLLTGSINRAGAKLGLTPTYTPQEKTHYKHLYNLSEMVRANLGSLVGSYAQRRNIMGVIAGLPSADPKEVAVAYKKLTGQRVSPVQLDKIYRSLKNTGSVDSLPSPPSKIPLWATDTHHCSMVQEGNKLRLTLKTQTGQHELTFTIPPHIPLNDVRFTRPTIMRNQKNQIEFHFTAEQVVPPAPTQVNGWLGVDLGIVKSYTATAVTTKNTSQSWTDTKQIMQLSEKIRVLQHHANMVCAKLQNNKNRYPERYEIQRTEYKHIKRKITRIKKYRAHLIANQLVKIAVLHNLGISLENLDWVPNSHWEQSLIQTKIKDEATRASIKIKKINAHNTSKTCSNCGSLSTTHSRRSTKCQDCNMHHDRDENASKNIANRAIGLKTSPKHYYRWQLRGTTVTGNPLNRVPFAETTATPIKQQLAIKARI